MKDQDNEDLNEASNSSELESVEEKNQPPWTDFIWKVVWISTKNSWPIRELKPYDLVNEKILDTIADAAIKNHTLAVTALSAASGAPSNPYLALGLAATDMSQYFAQVLMLSQKIAYIYGFPDLMDESENSSYLTGFG